MSDPEQQLRDAIHQQLKNAISYNLYTGLAYGMFLLYTSILPLSTSDSHIRHLGMFFAVYCMSIRILLCARSFICETSRALKTHVPHPSDLRDPCFALLDICSCSE